MKLHSIYPYAEHFSDILEIWHEFGYPGEIDISSNQ